MDFGDYLYCALVKSANEACNVIAVAVLTDAACVIIAEGAEPDEQVLAQAGQKGVNVLRSLSPAYETAVRLHSLLS